MKSVTFAHITFQTGHVLIQEKFTPTLNAQETLAVFQGPGYCNLLGIAVSAERRGAGSWIFDIFVDGTYVVRAYACYDVARVQECWEHAVGECQLRQRLLETVPWLVSPSVLSTVKPTGPFMLIGLQKGAGNHLEPPLILGDFERCLYWRFAQL